MKCNLSRILGEKRLKISNVVEDTGINRGTITRMYHETAQRIELDVLDALCCYLECSVTDILEPEIKKIDDSKRNPECESLADFRARKKG